MVPVIGINPVQGTEKYVATGNLRIQQKIRKKISYKEQNMLIKQITKKGEKIEKNLIMKGKERKEIEKEKKIAQEKHIRKKANERKNKNEIITGKMGNNKMKVATLNPENITNENRIRNVINTLERKKSK